MLIEDITPDYLLQHNINPEGLPFSKNHLPYNPRLKEFSRRMRGFGEKSEAMLLLHPCQDLLHFFLREVDLEDVIGF